MSQENKSNGITQQVLEEYVRITLSTTLAPHQAWKYAMLVMRYSLGIDIRTHTIHNPWKISRIVGEEYLLALKNESLPPHLALKLAVENSAKRLAIDTTIIASVLRCLSRKIQTHWRDRDCLWENISSPKNQSNLMRHDSWQMHPLLFESILRILYDYDPMGIPDHHESPTEYSIEVDTILPRLEEANSEDDVWRVVYKEFVRWFGDTARRRMFRFDPIAAEI